MSESDGSIPLEPSSSDQPAPQLNVVELAARRGLGPLSPLGQRAWHGQAKPCVSCGQLVHRSGKSCTECGQDLSDEMLDKMRAHCGPWYVHEHVRPFPGVSLERLIRQVRRGVLTRTTVVRGPATHHQWRFACETPGLSKYLGCCWVCHAEVKESDTVCHACGVDLDGGFSVVSPQPAEPASAASAEMKQLTTALSSVPNAQRAPGEDIARGAGGVPVSWVIAVLAVITLVAVLAVVRMRSGSAPPSPAVTSDVTVSPLVTEPAPSSTEPPAAAQKEF